jgi:hypothetical protein
VNALEWLGFFTLGVILIGVGLWAVGALTVEYVPPKK